MVAFGRFKKTKAALVSDSSEKDHHNTTLPPTTRSQARITPRNFSYPLTILHTACTPGANLKPFVELPPWDRQAGLRVPTVCDLPPDQTQATANCFEHNRPCQLNHSLYNTADIPLNSHDTLLSDATSWQILSPLVLQGAQSSQEAFASCSQHRLIGSQNIDIACSSIEEEDRSLQTPNYQQTSSSHRKRIPPHCHRIARSVDITHYQFLGSASLRPISSSGIPVVDTKSVGP